jgi:glucose 1-dehydrogenase
MAKVIDVNLTGQFLCAREATGNFSARRGSGDLARGGQDHLHELGARSHPVGRARQLRVVQGGVMQLMKSMAQELAPKKIRVNSVAPGAIQTPINRGAWETPEALVKLLTADPIRAHRRTG